MGHQTHRSPGGVWALAHLQHGVATRGQLLELGYSADAIKHRLVTGRLHPLDRGVYAVGRPDVGDHGRWMAAVLACGPDAALSHISAAALWRILDWWPREIHVSLRGNSARRRRGMFVHRRQTLVADDLGACQGIVVTRPIRTLIDIAPQLDRGRLEGAINEADRRRLADPEQLRSALDAHRGQPGVGVLRALLDRRTFRLTDSQLERLFLPITLAAGLPLPQTGRRLNGFKVDFFWPELGLVIETDGLRYHRTPAQQAKDRLRDQAHTAAGLVALRFTHSQVKFEPAHVSATLQKVVNRLTAAGRR